MTALYIAGPMSGLPDHNYPAFNAAAEQLRDAGYDVLNPVDIDHEATEPGTKPWAWYMRRTIAMLMQADHVATLDGCRNSAGAKVELHLADVLGMDCMPVWWWLEEATEAQEVAE